MMKNIGSAIPLFLGVFAFCALSKAAEAPVPEPFRGYDETSKRVVNYDVLSDLLSATVLEVESSNRTFASPPPTITGTRLKAKLTETSNEGNRFFFEAFRDNEQGQKFLREIQVSLEQLPSQTPLDTFSRDEQLAYWLNLYNVTVLNQIVAEYPKRSLRNLVRGKHSIFSKKLLTIAGIPLSLNDIQFTILAQNYDHNPLIIYGLYQGVVGGPSIRRSAFYGGDVWYALEQNAYEFINSNRGTRSYGPGTFRVSGLYDYNREFFPSFETDLEEHLLQYLKGDEREHLQSAADLQANIYDWTVTDMGGTEHRVGGSLANNPSALIDSYKSNHKSIFGGFRTATLEVIWKKDKPREELDPDTDFGAVPVEGAGVEGIQLDPATSPD